MSKFDQYIQKVLGSSMHSIELDITVVDETFLVSPNASQYAYMEAKNESVFEVFENISDIDSESEQLRMENERLESKNQLCWQKYVTRMESKINSDKYRVEKFEHELQQVEVELNNAKEALRSEQRKCEIFEKTIENLLRQYKAVIAQRNDLRTQICNMQK